MKKKSATLGWRGSLAGKKPLPALSLAGRSQALATAASEGRTSTGAPSRAALSLL
jgi:hypothetical protein